jgi:hypothetical protein
MAITVDVGKIKLHWRGTYSGATAYEIDDVVLYYDSITNSAYVCVADSTGNTPSTSGTVNTTYWNLLAQGASAVSAGTANGQVQYKNSTGFAATSNLFWDSSNNRLGINTNVPKTSLDVIGILSATSINSQLLTFNNLNVTGISTFNRTDINNSLFVDEVIEGVTVGTTANGTTNLDVKTSTVYLFNTNSTATWTHNVRGDGSTSLNNTLATGESITVTVISKQNNTSYYSNALNIDGSSVTIGWLIGATPSSGQSTSGYDVYTWNIIKTGSSTYVVFASQIQYG